jgi:hypothetical protein
MINERNLTLDHPIESTLPNTAAQIKNDNRSSSEVTEGSWIKIRTHKK